MRFSCDCARTGCSREQLFLETLCRTPNEQERLIARNLVAPNGKVTTEGLEDVLWTLFMHPEMQLIY